MLDFFDNTQFIHDLFSFVTDLGLRFAEAQIAAGADVIGIGDAAASLIGPGLYTEFVSRTRRSSSTRFTNEAVELDSTSMATPARLSHPSQH